MGIFLIMIYFENNHLTFEDFQTAFKAWEQFLTVLCDGKKNNNFCTFQKEILHLLKVTSQPSPHIKINNVLFIFYIFGNKKDSFKVSSSTGIAYFMSVKVTKVYAEQHQYQQKTRQKIRQVEPHMTVTYRKM